METVSIKNLKYLVKSNKMNVTYRWDRKLMWV